MVTTRLDKTLKLRVNFRPAKFAFFFAQEDADALAGILQFVCTQWGGIRNLIIPVQPDGQIPMLFQEFLKLAEPDRFVESLPPAKRHRSAIHDAALSSIKALFPERSVILEPLALHREFRTFMHPLSLIGDEDQRTHVLAAPRLEDDLVGH